MAQLVRERVANAIRDEARDGKNIQTKRQVRMLLPDMPVSKKLQKELNQWEIVFANIVTNIQAFKACPIATLWELPTFLKDVMGVDDLTVLGIGDIASYSSVKVDFKTNVIHEITSSEVFTTVLELKQKNRGDFVTPDAVRSHLSQKLGIDTKETGVIIRNLGHLIKTYGDAERKISAKLLEEKTSQLHNKNSAEYKVLSSRVERAAKKKLTKSLESQLKPAIATKNVLYTWARFAQLAKKKQKAITMSLSPLIEDLESGDLSLRSFIEEEEKVFIATNQDLQLKPESYPMGFLQFLEEQFNVSMCEYVVVHKDRRLVQKVTEEESETSSITVNYTDVKNELMRLLYENMVQGPYKTSEILKLLQDFADRNEIRCESSGSIVSFIISQPDLAYLLDMFSPETIPVIRAIREIVQARETLTNDQFKERILSKISRDTPKHWLSDIETLLLFKEYLESISDRLPTLKAISFEDELLGNPFDRNLLTNASNRIIDQINEIPYGVDMSTFLHWTGTRATEHGSLLNYLVRYESQLVGRCVVFSNGEVVRLHDTLDEPERLLDLNPEQVNLYIMEFLLFKRSSLEILVSKVTSCFQGREITENVTFCVDVIRCTSSILYKAWIFQHIFARSLGDFDDATLHQQFLKYWPSHDHFTLETLGKILSIQPWIEIKRKKTSLIQMELPNTSTVVSQGLSGGLKFDESESEEEELVEATTLRESSLDSSFDNEKNHVTESSFENSESISSGIVDQSPRAYIDSILRDKFAVHLQDDSNVKDNIHQLYEHIRGSVERLAEELYSEDIHFLMELIQNADDNDYDSSVTPSIYFEIHDDQILVGNNEKGFSKKNVGAICTVGKSTKEGNNRKGFIGKKGIGFKSVFRVTSAPEIHSNGYHISFDKEKEGELGYIKPTWLDEIHPHVDKLNEIYKTIIRIPYNTAHEQKEQSEKLQNEICRMDSSLILFLNTLREIHITIPNTNETRSIVRKDYKAGHVQITETIGEKQIVKRWLRISSTLDIPEYIRKYRKMDAYQTQTTICLAFPLEKQSNGEWHLRDQTCPAILPLFAYLPLKYKDNLRFVIQADFIVPSSRETIDRDNIWNQWIRDQIPILFANAIDTIREKSPEGTWIHSLNRIIPYIPNHCSEEFLCDLPNQVGSQLANTKWLVDSQGVPRCASELLYLYEHQNICTDSEDSPFTFFTNEILASHVGKCWIHPEIHLNRKLAELCKVEAFSLKHASKLFQETMEHENNLANPTTIAWIAKFVYICHKLFSSTESFLFQQELKSLAWIPLVNRAKLVAPENENRIIVLSQPLYELAKYCIDEHTNVINNALFCGLDDTQSSVLKAVLDRINVVHCSTVLDFMRFCVIPEYRKLLQSPEFASAHDSPVLLTDHPNLYEKLEKNFQLMKDSAFQDALQELSTSERSKLLEQITSYLLVPIGDHTVVYPRSVRLHFHHEKKKKGKDKKTKEVASIKSIISDWQSIPVAERLFGFFQEIGITFGPSVEEIKEETGLVNYISRELSILLDHLQQVKDKSQKQILSDFISMILEVPHTVVKDYYKRFFTTPQRTDSNFLTTLRKGHWVYCSMHKSLHAPSQCFSKESNADRLLGKNACMINWSSPTLSTLRVNQNVSFEHMHCFITQLIEQHQKKLSGGFATLDEEDHRILMNIYIEFAKKDSKTLHPLDSIPWIFIPIERGSLSGDFYYAASLFQRACKILTAWGKPSVLDFYDRKFQNLFQVTRVPRYPEPASYFQALPDAKKTVSPNELANQVWEKLLEWSEQHSFYPNLLGYLQMQEFFPVLKVDGGVSWAQLDKNTIYYPDSLAMLEIAPKLLSSEESTLVCILRIPKIDGKQFLTKQQKDFLQDYLNIHPLTENIMETTKPQKKQLDIKLYNIVEELLPLLERFFRRDYLLVKNCVDVNKKFFQELQFYRCDDIIVEYNIDNLSAKLSLPCHLDTKNKQMYWNPKNCDTQQIIDVLAKFLYARFYSVTVDLYDVFSNPKKASRKMDKARIPELNRFEWKLGSKDVYVAQKKEKIVINPNLSDRISTLTYEEIQGLDYKVSDEIAMPKKPFETPNDVEFTILPDDRPPLELPVHAQIGSSRNSDVLSSCTTTAGLISKETAPKESQTVRNKEDQIPKSTNPMSFVKTSSFEGGAASSIKQFDPSLAIPSICEWTEVKVEDEEQIYVATLSSNTDSAYKAEKLVKHVLEKKYPNKNVEWVNEGKESCKPYDLKVGEDHYIEVKFTSSATVQRNPFPMSYNELSFARTNRLDVYRVFGITHGPSPPSILVIEDINRKIVSKQATICVQPHLV